MTDTHTHALMLKASMPGHTHFMLHMHTHTLFTPAMFLQTTKENSQRKDQQTTKLK